MVQALGKTTTKLALCAALFGAIAATAAAQDDPPYRVARLNYITGSVSMEPAGVDDWAPAVINHPFTTGDYLYTDQGGRAELHLDLAALRMGPQTSFGFLNLNDQAVQIKLSEGDMYFRVHDLTPDQAFEVDTPNAAVTLLANGVYRFRVDPNGNMTFVVVRQGEAQVTGGGQAFTLNAGNSAMLSGGDQLSYDIEAAPAQDEFDDWCAQRDAHEEHLASARYIPPTVIGYEDLDDYGSWQDAPDYGPVWYPRSVPADWAPYHAGHWSWVEPWGWTWVDDAPWGFAPFHYGRWAHIGNRWGWCPGPIVVGRGPVARPYYAPALVAWFGGSNWGVSISSGGPSLGWVPLGFGEVFTPGYACSRNYFTNVNVHNTRIVKTVNITNVYNTVYVNHTVYQREFVNARAPGAVVAMPRAAFASGRPVREAAIVVRQPDPGRFRSAVVVAPGVAPTRQALAVSIGRPAPRPAPQVIARPVVARNRPGPEPAPFTARQTYLEQHANQLHNFAAMHQAIGARAVAAQVRQAPPAKPVPVHAGERAGNPAAFRQYTNAQQERPGAQARPGQPAAAQVRPEQTPAPQTRPAQTPAPQLRQNEPRAVQTRPEERPATPVQPAPGQPAATAAPHGTPPNIRSNNREETRPNARYSERQPSPAARETAPERTQPAPRVEAPPRPGERNVAPQQPVERNQAPGRVESRTPETHVQQPQANTERNPYQPRTQEAPRPAERNEAPAQRRQSEERTQPRPAAESHQAPREQPREEARPQHETPRPESRPAPETQEHHAPPAQHQDHKEKEKDKDK